MQEISSICSHTLVRGAIIIIIRGPEAHHAKQSIVGHFRHLLGKQD